MGLPDGVPVGTTFTEILSVATKVAVALPCTPPLMIPTSPGSTAPDGPLGPETVDAGPDGSLGPDGPLGQRQRNSGETGRSEPSSPCRRRRGYSLGRGDSPTQYRKLTR